MTRCRLRSRFLTGPLTVVVACALTNSSFADPQGSREYPPTYSSHKAPWYDPFGWFASTEKKTTHSTPTTRTEPSKPVANVPPGAMGAPAWKWYGYGTPLPGNSQYAPSVPGNWYSSTGATPGAIPETQTGVVVVDPFHPPSFATEPLPTRVPIITNPPSSVRETIVVPPVGGPSLPGVGKAPPITSSTDVNWQSTPASLRKPTIDSTTDNKPSATLKAPVRAEEIPTLPPPSAARTLPSPRTPAEAARTPGRESADIPVNPAPDIVLPPIK